ncbi:MAG: hypothetical protein EA403_09815 [Spirochaetaceae bacterium]|nr:MAG: hypothetical protein EA403_09815 [Spirochaetaceae bacterium]
MKKRLGRALFVIPVIYAGIIGLLVFLQFSDDQNFTYQFNGLTLRGRRALALEHEEAPITEVRLLFAGLEFPFTPESAVSLTGGDGTETILELLGYETLQDGFQVLLQNDVRVQFQLTGDAGDELHIRPLLPNPPAGTTAITIPYATVAGAQRVGEMVGNSVPIVFNSRTFMLAPPPRAVLSEAGLRLPTDVPSQTIRYTAVVEQRENVVERWFADRTLAIPDQTFDREIRDFIDRAYRGWRTTRFNAGTGRWTIRGMSPTFSEDILTATLAEAWTRGEFGAVFTDMRRAADLHPNQVGLLSSPFLGNLRPIKFQVQEQDTRTNQQLLQLATDRDPEVFRFRGLIPFALHRGSTQLADEVLAFLSEINYRDLDLYQTVGLLANATLHDNRTEAARRAFARFDAMIAERLFPALVRTSEGVFLESAPGQIDVELSLHAGLAIESEGRRLRNTRYLDIGRNLVVSALSLGDDEGFLPRVIIAQAEGVRAAEGVMGPEEIYPLISRNPAFPRMVSLHDALGPGAWIWTVAGITNVRASATEFSFTVQSPPNQTHYLIVQGVRPFASMELFGLEWRNDPSFEIYARGRHYNAQTRSLLIKYTDSLNERPVVLRF